MDIDGRCQGVQRGQSAASVSGSHSIVEYERQGNSQLARAESNVSRGIDFVALHPA